MDLVTEVCDVVCSPCDIFVWRQAAVGAETNALLLG